MDIFRDEVMKTLYSISENTNIINELAQKVMDKQMDPYSAADRLIDEFTNNQRNN